jgi:hypothetical protein
VSKALVKALRREKVRIEGEIEAETERRIAEVRQEVTDRYLDELGWVEEGLKLFEDGASDSSTSSEAAKSEAGRPKPRPRPPRPNPRPNAKPTAKRRPSGQAPHPETHLVIARDWCRDQAGEFSSPQLGEALKDRIPGLDNPRKRAELVMQLVDEGFLSRTGYGRASRYRVIAQAKAPEPDSESDPAPLPPPAKPQPKPAELLDDRPFARRPKAPAKQPEPEPAPPHPVEGTTEARADLLARAREFEIENPERLSDEDLAERVADATGSKPLNGNGKGSASGRLLEALKLRPMTLTQAQERFGYEAQSLLSQLQREGEIHIVTRRGERIYEVL